MTTLDRRSFLTFLGASSVSLVGCTGSEDTAVSQALDYSEEKRQAVVKALLDVFLPSGGPGHPGAAEVGAYDTLRAKPFVHVATELGFLPKLPPEWEDRLDDIDGLIKDILVGDLAAATSHHHGDRRFEDLSLGERTAIVEERSEGPCRPLYLYARAAAMIAFFGALWNDKGIVAIGIPAYENFADDLHNSGSTDFTYDRIPKVNGSEPWTITVDGDLP
jgi:hypothetical protein